MNQTDYTTMSRLWTQLKKVLREYHAQHPGVLVRESQLWELSAHVNPERRPQDRWDLAAIRRYGQPAADQACARYAAREQGEPPVIRGEAHYLPDRLIAAVEELQVEAILRDLAQGVDDATLTHHLTELQHVTGCAVSDWLPADRPESSHRNSYTLKLPRGHLVGTVRSAADGRWMLDRRGQPLENLLDQWGIDSDDDAADAGTVDTRSRLRTFLEDWDAAGMDAYDALQPR